MTYPEISSEHFKQLCKIGYVLTQLGETELIENKTKTRENNYKLQYKQMIRYITLDSRGDKRIVRIKNTVAL